MRHTLCDAEVCDQHRVGAGVAYGYICRKCRKIYRKAMHLLMFQCQSGHSKLQSVRSWIWEKLFCGGGCGQDRQIPAPCSNSQDWRCDSRPPRLKRFRYNTLLNYGSLAQLGVEDEMIETPQVQVVCKFSQSLILSSCTISEDRL